MRSQQVSVLENSKLEDIECKWRCWAVVGPKSVVCFSMKPTYTLYESLSARVKNQPDHYVILDIMRKWNIQHLHTRKCVDNTQEMLRQRGIKRFTHQLFALSGPLSFRHGKLHRIVLKAGYPMIDQNTRAFAALLDDTGVAIAFAQT